MTELKKYATGTVIKRLRKEKGLSQEVLSGFAGIARSQLSMIESGEKQANFDTIWKISNALGLEPHKLVKMIEDESLESYYLYKG